MLCAMHNCKYVGRSGELGRAKSLQTYIQMD